MLSSHELSVLATPRCVHRFRHIGLTPCSPTLLPPHSCNSKYIYGQASSASAGCSEFRAYVIDISISSSQIVFSDDYCGTLVHADSIGATGELYVYIGADDDSDSAEWQSLKIWGTSVAIFMYAMSFHFISRKFISIFVGCAFAGALSWDLLGTRSPSQHPTPGPSQRPVLAPTPLPTMPLGEPGLVDKFDDFDMGIWFAQCSGCTYESGSLMVSLLPLA